MHSGARRGVRRWRLGTATSGLSDTTKPRGRTTPGVFCGNRERFVVRGERDDDRESRNLLTSRDAGQGDVHVVDLDAKRADRAKCGELSEQAVGRRSAPSGCDRPGLVSRRIRESKTSQRGEGCPDGVPPASLAPRARVRGTRAPGPLLARSRTLGARRGAGRRGVQGGRRAAPVHRGPRAEPRFFRHAPGDGGGGGGRRVPRSAALHHERRSRDAEDPLSAPRRVRRGRGRLAPPPGRHQDVRHVRDHGSGGAQPPARDAVRRATRPLRAARRVAGRVGRGSGAGRARARARGARGRGDERSKVDVGAQEGRDRPRGGGAGRGGGGGGEGGACRRGVGVTACARRRARDGAAREGRGT